MTTGQKSWCGSQLRSLGHSVGAAIPSPFRACWGCRDAESCFRSQSWWQLLLVALSGHGSALLLGRGAEGEDEVNNHHFSRKTPPFRDGN